MRPIQVSELTTIDHGFIAADSLRYANRHARPDSERPIGPHDIDRVSSNIYWAALAAIDSGCWLVDETIGKGTPDWREALRRIANSAGYYNRRAGWRDTGRDETERQAVSLDAPGFSGTGLFSRTPSPVAMFEAIDRCNRRGWIAARTTNPSTLGKRSRIRCNKGHRTPPLQRHVELVRDSRGLPGGAHPTIYTDGQPVATRVRVMRYDRYQLRPDQLHTGWKRTASRYWTDTIPRRELPTVRLGVPRITPAIRDTILFGRSTRTGGGFANWIGRVAPLPARLGGDPFTFYRADRPQALRPLPRTENETTPVRSPVRWNQTHTSAERQLIGIEDLTG